MSDAPEIEEARFTSAELRASIVLGANKLHNAGFRSQADMPHLEIYQAGTKLGDAYVPPASFAYDTPLPTGAQPDARSGNLSLTLNGNAASIQTYWRGAYTDGAHELTATPTLVITYRN